MPNKAAWLVLVVALAIAATAAGCSDATEQPRAAPSSSPGSTIASGSSATSGATLNKNPWPMHPIDGRFRGANALGAADVNGDGHRDYVTNYEFDQRWILALHPGSALVPRTSWPTVEIWKPEPFVSGNGKNPESTALGDLDGDGNIDAVGAHGFSDITAFEGSAPGIHVVWGPSAERVSNPDAWIDGGWVPKTVDLGHPHWVVAHDVNGDGLTDAVFGGRQHGGGGGYENPDSPSGNGTFTGIAWLQAPADPARRRDLSTWELHHIDADVPSGHGFVFADVDGDGDEDIVDATADFDTPEEAEEVAWYENPGNGTAEQNRQWPRAVVYRSSQFYAKPSVAVGDLDGDGDADLVTQTDRELLLFRNQGGSRPEFDTVALTKPDAIAWRARPVRLADFDRDGDLDILGMLIHVDNDLPASKAAVFLYLNRGDPFASDGWELVPIKWGSGTTMALPGFGEKWDQVDVTDVDGDGDLDVVANCEEWWASPQFEAAPFFTPDLIVSSVAVVWFENTLTDPQTTITQSGPMITIQAEAPTLIGDSSWVERAPVSGDAASSEAPPVAAMQAHNGLSPQPDGTRTPQDTVGLTYAVDADGGDYVIWARVWVPDRFAPRVGGATADSAWLLIDDREPKVLGEEPAPVTNVWHWVRVSGTTHLSPGRHELQLRVREPGFAIDQILLSTDTAATPS